MIDLDKLRNFDSSFRRFDATGSGRIDATRFHRFMNFMLSPAGSLPPPPAAHPPTLIGIATLDPPASSTFSRAEADYLFRAYDLDGDAAITKVAARRIVAAVASRSPCAKCAILFRSLDRDRDGLLALAEVEAAAELLGRRPGDAAAALSGRADGNGGFGFAAFYFFATGTELPSDVDPYKFFRKMPSCCAVA
jgi:Ca2+-binding EF-hand superfamily protein